jgi:NDP-sugar pyrophosphorylase family protein
MGTRLKSEVPDRPKGLAELRGRPFLDLLVEQLVEQGVRHLIFAVGYLGEQIVSHFTGTSNASLLFSKEDFPLGTGGAVLKALHLVKSDPFLVLNGDSICPVNYSDLLNAHCAVNADITITVARPDGRSDAGAILLGQANRIIGYSERGANAGGFVNAGVYMLARRVFEQTQLASRCSLEYDLFPVLAARGRSYGFPIEGELVDIGTPQRLRSARERLF